VILNEPILWRWFYSFIFTLSVEVPIFMLFAYKQNVPWWRAALAGAAGTCFTHPALWFMWRPMFDVYFYYIISGELLVSCIESFTFWSIARPINLTRAISAAFIANAGSYGLGNLLRYLDLWKYMPFY